MLLLLDNYLVTLSLHKEGNGHITYGLYSMNNLMYVAKLILFTNQINFIVNIVVVVVVVVLLLLVLHAILSLKI